MSQPADSSPVAQALLRSVLDGFPDGLLVVAAEDRVVYLNGAAAAWLGQPRAALLDQPLGALLPGPAVGRVERVTPDGDRRTAAVRSQPVEWDGRPARLLSLQDTTSQVAVQHRLRLLVTAVEQAPDPVLVTNADGLIEYVNPAFETVTGYAASEVIGQTPRILKSGEHDEAFYGQLWSTLKAGEVWRGQFHNRRRDGSLVHEEAVISPLRAADGEIVSFVAVLRDLTEQIELAEQLRQAVKMEAVGQLAAGVAHDFNNLLAGISGSFEMIGTRLAQGRRNDVEKYLAAGQGAARRASALTHRLLAFSRRQTLSPKPVQINRLMAELVELVERTVGPSITVETVAAGGLWATMVDANQLENALLNLCINARDAMPGGGKIIIETGNKWLDRRQAAERGIDPGQYVTVCVSDNGVGIEKSIQDRVFDPFFTTKPLGEGTGLGLSMVYGFARQSNGHVRIYSEVGEGTMVCIYLPRYLGAEAGEEEAADTLPGATADHAGETVLIVDDEPTVRMLIADALEELGYACLEAADGPAGLKLLQSDARIDLLITDVGLPGGLNGRQVADAARGLRADLKVLFITGYAENAVLNHGHIQHGMEVLTKPFAVGDLTARVERLLARD